MDQHLLSFNGILGRRFIPDFSTILPAIASRRSLGNRQVYGNQARAIVQLQVIEEDPRSPLFNELPPFVRILNTLLVNTGGRKENQDSGGFITNVGILHDVAFSPRCPILGTGHHFAVFAAPFEVEKRGFIPADGRAINPEVYCLKTPNFTSSGATDAPASRSAFRTEYYSTALLELRVLLHPQLRRCENIINLFGLDFQEDYDDYTVAWPVLLMEYAEYGTLATLQEDTTIQTELARVLLLDVARGIRALHECNIVHGDVKAENVLICRHAKRKYCAKLADFGLSIINPADGNLHRLPGGTFLWSAPEIGSALSVEGLRQADVYSFGLTAWRVLANRPNPFVLITPTALGIQAIGTLNEAVTLAKSHHNFDKLVLQSLGNIVNNAYSRQVIQATLGKDPITRSLGAALSALSHGQENMLHNESEPSETYWAMEEPSLVLEQLDSVWTDTLPSFAMKPAVIHSLATGLDSIFNSNSKLNLQAGWILFQFLSSSQFQCLGKDPSKCCQILTRLCQLGIPSAQSIVFRYFSLHGTDFHLLDPKWLENAAADGSYYALKSLRVLYPEKYRQLFQSGLSIEPDLTDVQEYASILRCCRQGDYAGCESLLKKGVPAFPIEEGKVSPLHWLVSFHDEYEIQNLLKLLVRNGAIIDAWEGEGHDFAFGRVTGTPLHWAVWYRNIPVLRALITVDNNPKASDLNRALFIAAGMHFHDVFDILKTWLLSLKDATRAQCNWRTVLLCVAENSTWQLARRLRHGDKNLSRAFEKTMDSVSALHRPSSEDIKLLFQMAISQNHHLLLRYMFRRQNLGRREDILKDPNLDPVLVSICLGFREIFEQCIESGVLGPETVHGKSKWKALQVCCFTRQRDRTFARRLLEIECPVDGASDDTEATWTPFAIAVSTGLYDVAIMLLEHGADKDHLLGWLGGSTVTMNLLQNWPDIPISRLKFLLEEIPRRGFGHVTFWGWPGADGNLLYALAMNHWSSYTAGYRLGETAKYILGQLADKSCLNRIDKVGATALRMACANGNLEICRALIEAGQDVNLALGYSPLGNALDWMEECRQREKNALSNRNCPGSERRLATTLRKRAEETVQLMKANGAINRGFFESMQNTRAYLESGQWQPPSFATTLEMFSGVFDKKPLVKAGSTPLQPTSATQFKAHHGQRGVLQAYLANLGSRMDQAKGQRIERPPGRWQQHNCLPWRNDYCRTCPIPGFSNPHQAFAPQTSIVPRQAHISRPLSTTNTSSRQSFPFGADTSSYNDLYDASSVRPKMHRTSDNTDAVGPVNVEKVEQCLKDHLLLWFLDGGHTETEKQRRDKALCILREQLQSPILLDVPCRDIDSCEEFYVIENVVERCLECMCIGGISVIPELRDSGRELVVHVSED